MKKNKIFIALGMLLLMMGTTTSCDDMLTVDTGDKSYENANDTLYSYLGIMKCVQNLAERQVVLNEVRGDLTTSTEYVTDTLHAISNFEDPKDGTCTMLNISDYYEVINNCNLYIAHADTSKVKANQKYMLPEYAQVQAVRAWTYLQLVNIYGEVPFIVEPIHNLDVTISSTSSSSWASHVMWTQITQATETTTTVPPIFHHVCCSSLYVL